jgi:hypothetical protein
MRSPVGATACLQAVLSGVCGIPEARVASNPWHPAKETAISFQKWREVLQIGPKESRG